MSRPRADQLGAGRVSAVDRFLDGAQAKVRRHVGAVREEGRDDLVVAKLAGFEDRPTAREEEEGVERGRRR
jgi:hypothetical protein